MLQVHTLAPKKVWPYQNGGGHKNYFDTNCCFHWMSCDRGHTDDSHKSVHNNCKNIFLALQNAIKSSVIAANTTNFLNVWKVLAKCISLSCYITSYFIMR